MQVAAACLAEGKEARHEAIAVDDLHLHRSGGAGRIPPRHRGRLTIVLLQARALCGTHLLLRHLCALSRLRLLLEKRAQPGHLVGVPPSFLFSSCAYPRRPHCNARLFIELHQKLCVLGPPCDVLIIRFRPQMV